MLAANETVAEEYFWREIPFLYRTHEAPEEDKVKKLSTFINNFGYHIHMGNEIRPKEIQKLLEKVEGTPQEALISRLALRSMKQARYTPEKGTSVWRRSIIHILRLRSGGIRICKSTGSLRRICAAD